MKLKDLSINPQNPRYLTEADFQKLLNKLLTFPRLLEKNKITFDSEQGNTILGGNMRFKALNYICDTYTRESIFDAVKTAQNSLNVDNADLMEESVTVFTRIIEKRYLPENWVQDAKGLSEEEKQAFIVIDNVSDGKWDFDVLANNWDIDTFEFGVVDWKVGNYENDNIFDNDGDVLDDESNQDSSSKKESKGISSDNYSALEIVMLHENKKRVFEVLNKIKSRYNLEKFEDCLLKLIELYKD